MSEKKYENIIKETIILTNLKYLDVYDSIKYDIIKNMKLEKEKNEPNKTEQEIETEIFEEIFKLKKGNYEKYYKIDEQKSKELELVFKQIKLIIKFKSKLKLLRDGLFYTIYKGNFTIYNNKTFNKLYEIKFGEKCNSVILLDNKDLVFLSNNQLIIYRLQKKNIFYYKKLKKMKNIMNCNTHIHHVFFFQKNIKLNS